MSCLKPNFSSEIASGEINSSLFGEYTNLDELINNIKSGLKECSFGTTIDESDNQIDYEKSVDLLINTILDKLNNLNSIQERKIKSELRKELLPNSNKVIKTEVHAIIPDAQLYSEQERKSKEYDDILDEFFIDNIAAKQRRSELLSAELLLQTIINVDPKNPKIIANVIDLNENLERFKANEYLKIKNYLLKLGYTGYSSGMYSSKHRVNPSVDNVLRDIYNIIQEKKSKGEFEKELRDSWTNSIFGKNSEFYDVVNAYINIMYFDKVVEEALGKYIRIDDSVQEPITRIEDKYGIVSLKYKYTFNAGNSETVKGWETAENRDAIKEMGKFSKLLIESIPMYNYGSKEKMPFNLNAVRFSNAITRLLDLSNELIPEHHTEFLKLINTRHHKSEESFPEILNMLFDGKHKTLVSSLKDLGLTDFDLNVLYSIKKRLYDGQSGEYNSYNKIEQAFLKERGEITTRYPIVRTLLGVVDSIVTMNYLQSKYNNQDSEQQVSIKLKFPTDKTVYETVNTVNKTIVSTVNKTAVQDGEIKPLLEVYSLIPDGKNYKVKIDDAEFTIAGTASTASLGPLSKSASKGKTKNSEIRGLPETITKMFMTSYEGKKISLNTTEERRKLLSRSELSEDETLFINLLRYVDDVLNTRFSHDEDGLLLFNVFGQLNKSGLEHLLLAASRGLIITDIYNKFNQERESLNLTELEIIKYFEKNPSIYQHVNIANLDLKTRKRLFRRHSIGEYMTTISESEQWLHDLSHAQAILSGEVSKAVIKNLDGDSVPNFSPAFEGSFIKKRSYEAYNKAELEIEENGNAGIVKETSIASSHLMFSKDRSAIKKVVIDTDVVVRNGATKQVKNMTKGELLIHSIVDKYFLPSLKGNDQLIIQPTSYSDKTKLVNYIISKNFGNINLLEASTEQLEQLMLDTLGNFYKTVWNNVLEDYEKLFGTRDVKDISKILKTHSIQSLVDLGKTKGVEIHVDTHYRNINGKLFINELLHQYANHTYNNIDELRKRLALEKQRFVESLIKNRVHFNLNFERGELKGNNDLTTVLLKLGKDKAKQWVSGKKMIIAKIIGADGKKTNILYGTKIALKSGETLQLNPLLENYFMVHSLTGNNLRYILSGSEINHKIKELNKLNLVKTSFANFTNILNSYGLDLASASLVDLDQIITTMEINKDVNAEALRSIYDKYILDFESQGQIAQIKRNVIIPATLRYYLQGTLDGILPEMKFAVVNDIKAFVFNFDGIADEIDAHDGAALEDPFTSRLENLSLQDNEVGTIKKPIWHHYNHRYGTAFLAKYAVHTMTNQWMRQSEASDISLQRLFKKMTDIRWDQKYDLMNSAQHKLSTKLNFLADILEGKSLFYRKGNKHYQIIDFVRDNNGDYYTVEQEVSSLGYPVKDSIKTAVYHYFDVKGNHYTVSKDLSDLDKPHDKNFVDKLGNVIPVDTVNSLYQLHTALGGIWCESLTNNGLQYSEASVNAVVNFMNNVTILKEGADRTIKTQSSYYQPLKHFIISYVGNNSSVKNGAANINSSSVYYDEDSKLSYMTVTTEGHGIQMDADHVADEAQMTEFSQVISSLDAGGRLHSYVKQIYDVLGRVALEQAQIEVHALKEFKNTGNVSAIYDIVGRTIINNLASKQGQAGLAESIIKTIKKKFDLNSDHVLDTFKIPFSDPNIYSNILSTFVSIINNKSIKRKYPGQGTVMVPGYGMSQIWEFDGRTYQYEDLIKLAQKNLPNIEEYSTIQDISLYNKTIVNEYLKLKQNSVDFVNSLNSFMPTDNVDVYVNGGFKQTVELKNISDYYEFKEAPSVFLLKKYGIVTTNDQLTYKKNITKARDLAPAKIAFKYLDENNNIIETNVFDTQPLVEAYKLKLKRSNPEVQAKVQKMLDGLEINRYYHTNGNLIDEQGDRYYQITEITNTPAELIMSNIYKSRFGIKDGQSLNDVLDDPLAFIKDPEVISSDFYDLVFTRGNGDHLYITFNKLKSKVDSEEYQFDYTRKDWKFINRAKFDEPTDVFTYNPETKTYTKGGTTILNRVYATDKNNIRLFEIGRDIINKEVVYDSSKRKFVNKSGEVVKNQKKYRRISETEVAEYVEFVHRNEVIENGKKHTVYNIDKNALLRVLSSKTALSADEDANKYISVLLGKIYKSQNHNGVLLQTDLKRNSALILESTLKGFGNQLAYDNNLRDFIYKSYELLKGAVNIPIDEKGEKFYSNYLINVSQYDRFKRAYLNKLRVKIATSFAKAQYFTASRIPAQTLQSFMQMRCVGFTGTDTNQCFVSHWQTWLQGSDYDIDKAYIMGHSFDDNGVYIGWSNLFNYSSLEALKASEQLPMPSGRRYNLNKDGYDLTQYEELYNTADDVDKIKLITKILNELNEIEAVDGVVLVNSSNESLLYQDIISHEDTKLPQDLKLESFKNFISSHIETVIQNPRNMIGAYTPIAMEVLRDGTAYSKKNVSKQMTLVNPASIYEMQYASMVGKKVIGIAATGEKASFMWHYWLNESVRGDLDEYNKYGKLNHSLSRIHNRHLGNPSETNINCLPDVNLEEVSLDDVLKLTGLITVDGMISQVLSAATDNVKELILDKINAGSKLAKCYLYLITLGYNINDIVSFMTSDVISFIDDLTENNIYDELNLTIDQAVEIAKGKIPKDLEKKFLSGTALNKFRKDNKDWKDILINKDLVLKNQYEDQDGIEIQNFIDFLNELKAHYPTKQTQEEQANMLKDIEDFEKVIAGANEFSNLGRLLGLNQGLPTSKVDLRKLLDFINSIVADREKELEIVNKDGVVNTEKLNELSGDYDFSEIAGKFDVIRFLNDEDYRNLAIEYQNAIKENIPIFKIVNDIPQFKSILDLLNVVCQFDKVVSVKSKMFDKIMDQMKEKKYYVDDYMQKGILSFIDDLIILDFMETYNYKFPVQENTKLFDSVTRTYTSGNTIIQLNTPFDIASFKRVFETVLIPNLQNGQYYDGNKVINDPDLRNNKFIQDLIRTNNRDIPLYKVNLDMLAKDSSASSILKFQNYVRGLRDLKDKYIGNISISDWFMIYNLIVNKNNYGSDRMTTLLQEFVSENSSNFLMKYLNHIGKLDYNQINNLKYTLQDVLVATAKTVSSTVGHKEPMLILSTEEGPKLMERRGGTYAEVDKLLPIVNGEKKEQFLQRLNDRQEYFTLRINYSSYVEESIKQLNKLDNDTINLIKNLIKQGNLIITNICE